MEVIGWGNTLLILNSGEGVPFRTEKEVIRSPPDDTNSSRS